MVKVFASAIIDAPIADVWAILRDFNGHDRWHPTMAICRIEAGSADCIGAVCRFRLQDGAELREQLLALSDSSHELRYGLLASPIALMGYVALVRLLPVTDGNRTFWEWSSEFQPPPGRSADLIALVRAGIYKAGFKAIRDRLQHGAALKTPVPQPAPQPPTTPKTQTIILDHYGGPEV